MCRTKLGLLLVLVPIVCLLGTGCEKGKKSRTTPKASDPEGPTPLQLSSKGEVMLKCKQEAGTRIVTLDLNRDKKRDRWILFDKGGKKLCHEMDTDYDGKRDLSITYFDDGVTARIIWWDLDYDGEWDQVMYNRPDGTKERVEIRSHAPTPQERKSGEWKPTVWKFYRNVKGKGTVIERVEMDKSRNGYKDYWERYEDGVLQEVSWADPSDTDERPKHWIEAPEEGKDKGYRGEDESESGEVDRKGADAKGGGVKGGGARGGGARGGGAKGAD